MGVKTIQREYGVSQDIPGLMGFVVRELKVNPDGSSGDLYERSLGRYPAVARLTVREFHARYVVKVKKQMKNRPVRRFPLPREPLEVDVPQPAAEPAPTPLERKLDRREAMRLLLFRLAMDFETSQTDPEIVDVFARLDTYVEEGLAIVGG